jgi:hypothetical protein
MDDLSVSFSSLQRNRPIELQGREVHDVVVFCWMVDGGPQGFDGRGIGCHLQRGRQVKRLVNNIPFEGYFRTFLLASL